MADETVYLTFEVASDDDGATWSNWLPFLEGRRPHIVAGNFGELLRVVRCADCGLRATLEYPGDSSPRGPFVFNDAFGAPLQAGDDYFSVIPEPGGPGRWLLLVNLVGGTACSLLRSADECATWEFVGTMFSGGVSPAAAVSPNGTILFAARVGETVHGRIQAPGEGELGPEFTFASVATLVTVLGGGSFGVALAHEGPARGLLAAGTHLAGEDIVADWVATDDGPSWELA